MSRKFISAMQVSLDGFVEDADSKTDWVDSWADAIQLIDDVDMFLLGGNMYPGYGEYWGSIHADPQRIPPNPEVPSQEGRLPSSSEIAYARLAAQTPHVVLSTTLNSVSWPKAQIVRDLDEVRALKGTPRKEHLRCRWSRTRRQPHGCGPDRRVAADRSPGRPGQWQAAI